MDSGCIRMNLIPLANAAALVHMHQDYWPSESAKCEILNAVEKFNEGIANAIDWDNLTKEEAIQLGFVTWSGSLFLIPAYLYGVLPEDKEFFGIMGGTYFKKDMDIDTRFGCLQYGIKF